MTDLNFGLYYPLYERTIDTNIDAMATEMAKHSYKIVEVRAIWDRRTAFLQNGKNKFEIGCLKFIVPFTDWI